MRASSSTLFIFANFQRMYSLFGSYYQMVIVGQIIVFWFRIPNPIQILTPKIIQNQRLAGGKANILPVSVFEMPPRNQHIIFPISTMHFPPFIYRSHPNTLAKLNCQLWANKPLGGGYQRKSCPRSNESDLLRCATPTGAQPRPHKATEAGICLLAG